MARILVLYGSTHGHTAKIAEFVGETLRRLGHEAEVVCGAGLAAGFDPSAFDAAIVGGSLHLGRHQACVRDFVIAHRAWLDTVPTAFFSVSLTAVGTKPKEKAAAQACIARFLDVTGWRPGQTTVVAGALPYSRYGFLTRLAMRFQMARAGGPTDMSQDYEFTDWAAVERFVRDFAVGL